MSHTHRGLSSQQGIFHKAKKDSVAAVEATYVLRELITKAGKPFTRWLFLKDCMSEVNDILCPEKKSLLDLTVEFLREFPLSFPELSKVLRHVMCLFGSNYWCKKLFLTMNFNKMQVQVPEAHLETVFRVSTMTSIRANCGSAV